MSGRRHRSTNRNSRHENFPHIEPRPAAIAAGPARQADRGGLAGGPDGGGRHGLVGLVRLVYYRHLDCRPACLHGRAVRRVRPVGRHPPAGHRPHGFALCGTARHARRNVRRAGQHPRATVPRLVAPGSGQPPAAPAGQAAVPPDGRYRRARIAVFAPAGACLHGTVRGPAGRRGAGRDAVAAGPGPGRVAAGRRRRHQLGRGAACPPSRHRALARHRKIALRHHRPGGRPDGPGDGGPHRRPVRRAGADRRLAGASRFRPAAPGDGSRRRVWRGRQRDPGRGAAGRGRAGAAENAERAAGGAGPADRPDGCGTICGAAPWRAGSGPHAAGHAPPGAAP